MMMKDGRLLICGDAHGGVFGMMGHAAHVKMQQLPCQQQRPQSYMWHRHYGHLGSDNLAKLAEGGLVTGMTVTAAEFKAASKKPCMPHLQAAQDCSTKLYI